MSDESTILFTSVEGIPVTQAMIDEWADAAERGELPGKPGPVRKGRPVVVGRGANRTVGLRLDEQRFLKLQQLAKDRHTNKSEVMRQLIDAA
jgi:predicted transcriptional regulator